LALLLLPIEDIQERADSIIMSASRAPENEVVTMAFLVRMDQGCAVNMDNWEEAETELMRLYDEYSAIEMYEILREEAWNKSSPLL
jgi:hypothetical protein